jgi:hypothetical protein
LNATGAAPEKIALSTGNTIDVAEVGTSEL